MIQINKLPGQKVLELGGGLNRHSNTDCNVDARALATVDFVANFSEPLPIASEEWDWVLCFFALEHVPYPKTFSFIQEVYRVCKSGGRVVFTAPNTEAQLRWIQDHPAGWNGKDCFIASSELLFGTQDTDWDSHKNYFTLGILQQLFMNAGFQNVVVSAWGEAGTDALIEAMKPMPEKAIFKSNNMQQDNIRLVNAGIVEDTSYAEKFAEVKKEMKQTKILAKTDSKNPLLGMTREEMFDKHYWNGGDKVGGYAREGYWDFPVHEKTAAQILKMKPKSILEMGCGRSYLGKRFEDAGIPYVGLEISKHCWLTRASDNVILHDVCKTPWPIDRSPRFGNEDGSFDLAFSIAVFEHIPEEFLPEILSELKRLTKRGIHGIDFGKHDDGFDKTHCNLASYGVWRERFDEAGLEDHEIVDKEELELGIPPRDLWSLMPAKVMKGDGKLKLNIGCFMTQFHHGWKNLDLPNPHVQQFAAQHHYDFQGHDVRNGLPFGTGTVDAAVAIHMIEHLTYDEGKRFLKELRRVCKPNACIRIQVPDAMRLMRMYEWEISTSPQQIANGENKLPVGERISDFDEVNDGCARATTPAGKFWALLHEGHQSCYDGETLLAALQEAGFEAQIGAFRKVSNHSDPKVVEGFAQILKETLDTHPPLTLTIDAIPRIA